MKQTSSIIKQIGWQITISIVNNKKKLEFYSEKNLIHEFSH